MSFLIIFLGIVAVLFVLAYVTKRRFGLLGLALAAGALLSSLWVGDLTPIIAGAGIVVVEPPLETIVSVGLTLLPAILLLFSGPVYKGKLHRVVGAAVFALLAGALLLPTFGSALVVDEVARPAYDVLSQYRPVIITFALVYAIGDLVVAKSPKHRGREH